MERNVVAIIPARSGSKGVPYKNEKLLAARPLISYTIQSAIEAGCFDRILVSTDSEKIADIAVNYGAEVPALRPDYLSGGDANVIDAVKHILSVIDGQPSGVMLLQPTSPFRKVETIRGVLELYFSCEGESVVTLSKATSHPLWCKTIGSDDTLLPYIEGVDVPAQRQILDKCYMLNGLAYVATLKTIRENNSFYSNSTKAYAVQSKIEAIDIDDALDWELAEVIVSKGLHQ